MNAVVVPEIERGPCAKRRVICIIKLADDREFIGENDCANPQAVCPRLPTEGYAKCDSICRQGAHAEIAALMTVGDESLEGAVATVWGHFFICSSCAAALYSAGINVVRILSRPVPLDVGGL